MTLQHVDLRCEYLRDPDGIDEPQPILSWAFALGDPAVRGSRQRGYQVLVASDPSLLEPGSADLWDSGRIDSEVAAGILYEGVSLRSRMTCWWTVRSWDDRDVASAWAAPARWSMGLLEPADWSAVWVGLDEPVRPASRLPARMLRREFEIHGPITRATAYVAGLGFHEVEINGRRVGDHVFDPALTNYDHRVFYVTHDVTDALEPGPNAIGILLGNGRFFALRWIPPELPQPRGPNPDNWFEEYVARDYGFPKLLFQLEIDYADGSNDVVVSDERWRLTADGPIRANNEYDGEEYDARLEQDGWSSPGFDDRSWRPAERVSAPNGALQAQAIEPMRVVETLPAVTIEHDQPGRWIADVGQVIYGRPNISVRGPRAARVEIKGAYSRGPDGRLLTEFNRTALITDVYILRGNGSETWQPRFRGQGFRHLEVRSDPGVELDRIEAQVLSTDSAPVGAFSCSDPLLNRLWSNIRYGHRAFKRSVPMDPDRIERMPWLGDPAKVAESDGYYFDVAAFYRKWLDDIVLDQHPDGELPEVAPAYWESYRGDLVWPSAAPIIAEWLYDFYGDIRAVRRLYPALVRWTAFAETLKRADGTWDCNYGDWCDVSTIGYGDERPSGATPRPLIATAYQANNLRITARFAGLLGHSREAGEFLRRNVEVKGAFQRAFFDPVQGVYGTGTQTSYVLPLAFGLVAPEDHARVVANLVTDIVERHDGHLSVGLIGIQWLMQTLVDVGHPEVAYLIATQTTRPSWGYMVEHGATSIWERWDSDTQGSNMNSENLLILAGNLGSWFYQALAGIALDPSEPAWRRISLRPRPVGSLRWVSARFESIAGMIGSEWAVEEGRFTWQLTVPPNTIATAWVPTSDVASVMEGGADVANAPGLTVLRVEQGALVLRVEPGRYDFSAQLAETAIPDARRARRS